MVIAFSPRHLDEIELIAEHRAIADANRGSFDLLARFNLATTVVSADHRTVLGVLGAAIDPNGPATECEVFIFPSAALKSYPVTFMRSVRQEIDRIRDQFDKIRAAGSDTALSRRFLSSLGFQLEGLDMRPQCAGKLMWVMNGGRS